MGPWGVETLERPGHLGICVVTAEGAYSNVTEELAVLTGFALLSCPTTQGHTAVGGGGGQCSALMFISAEGTVSLDPLSPSPGPPDAATYYLQHRQQWKRVE